MGHKVNKRKTKWRKKKIKKRSGSVGHGEQKKRKKNKVEKKRREKSVGNEMLAKVCAEKSKMGGIYSDVSKTLL